MPTPTYIPLATVTLGSSASSVTFSSIPATYRDLVLVYNGTNNSSTSGMLLRLNADSGNNYNDVIMANNGNTPTSATQSSTSNANIFFGTTVRTLGIAQFMDYSATDKHKAVLIRDNAEGSVVRATAIRWANTAAITSIQVLRSDTTIATGATFNLYGISA
jgi:hypothetical protein